jgi:hypothetical protein
LPDTGGRHINSPTPAGDILIEKLQGHKIIARPRRAAY